MELGDRALPLTRGQLDIWLAQETGHFGTGWQLGLFVRIEGTVDRDALERAIRRAVREAEPARAAIFEVDGEVFQRPIDYPDVELTFFGAFQDLDLSTGSGKPPRRPHIANRHLVMAVAHRDPGSPIYPHHSPTHWFCHCDRIKHPSRFSANWGKQIHRVHRVNGERLRLHSSVLIHGGNQKESPLHLVHSIPFNKGRHA
jgi:hypothetical protein